MLSKHRLARLFEANDLNVPVTIFNIDTLSGNTSCSKQTWFCTIKESLGKALNDSEQLYHFQITSIKGKIYTLYCTGSQFIDELHSLFLYKEPLSIRIEILENYDCAWIILLKNDL